MNYGLPYKGSKNKIAEWVVAHLPKATHFYDLFAGGCAITHCAALSGKFEVLHANDLNGSMVELFKGAMAGDYANETRWISREDFLRLKDSDPYVASCWSFGNNLKGYMYSEEIEPWKKALHYARVFGDCSLLAEFGIESDGSRQDVIENHEEYKVKYIRWWLAQQKYSAEELDELITSERLNVAKEEEELRAYLLNALRESGLTQREVGRRLDTQMEHHYFGRSQWQFPTKEHYRKMQIFMPALDRDYNEIVGLYRLSERLESLQRLQRLQRLQTSATDYRKVRFEEDAVIYCDPPYKGTDGYLAEFDHEEFYSWLREIGRPVYVSEYNMPADFVPIAIKVKAVSLCGGSASKAIEAIWLHKRWVRWAEQTLF